jgi:hypothetical protein
MAQWPIWPRNHRRIVKKKRADLSIGPFSLMLA